EIVKNGSIAIDGDTATGADLQNRLGPADADPVLRLSYLSASQRLTLFQLQPQPLPETEPVERTGAGGPGHRGRVGGDAIVDETEQVSNVTTILGTAVVDGVVAHDVIAIGGDVRLGPKAIVRGTVSAIGGQVHADPNARVFGQVNELSLDSANLR